MRPVDEESPDRSARPAGERRLTGVLVAAFLVLVAGAGWWVLRDAPSIDPPPVTAVPEDSPPPSSEPPSSAPAAMEPGEGIGVVLRVGEDGRDDGIITHDDLVRTTFATDAVGAERVRAALEASADGAPTTVLSPSAVPDVSIDGGTLVLDWSSEDAAPELGIWSTSSGSQALWPIFGMVFTNTDVDRLENRIDGSCEAWGERMQIGRCLQTTRAQWDAFVTAGDPPGAGPIRPRP